MNFIKSQLFPLKNKSEQKKTKTLLDLHKNNKKKKQQTIKNKQTKKKQQQQKKQKQKINK